MQGLEEIRAALQHSFVTSDLTSPDPAEVTTPDSVDSWAPVWTPASSIGTGQERSRVSVLSFCLSFGLFCLSVCFVFLSVCIGCLIFMFDPIVICLSI